MLPLKMTRTSNYLPEEIEALISCLEETPQLVYGEFGGDIRNAQEQKRRWEKIAEVINSVSRETDLRSAIQVRNKWFDLKYRVRAKAAKIMHSKESGETAKDKLSKMEEKVMNLMCYNSFKEKVQSSEHELSLSQAEKASTSETNFATSSQNDCGERNNERSEIKKLNQQPIISPVVISLDDTSQLVQHINYATVIAVTADNSQQESGRPEAARNVYYAVAPVASSVQEKTGNAELVETLDTVTSVPPARPRPKATGPLDDDNNLPKSPWPSLVGKEKQRNEAIKSQNHRLKRQRIREEEEREVERKVVQTQENMAKDIKEINSSLKNIEKALERSNRNQETMIALLARYLDVEIHEADA